MKKACKRCRDPHGCCCGAFAFELGALMMAVGRYLHRDDFSLEQLGEAYRELAKRVPGKFCRGCRWCPRK